MIKMTKQFYGVIFSLLFLSSFLNCSSTGSKGTASNVRMCINKIESEGVEPGIINRISSNLYKILQEAKGKDKVVSRSIDGVSKSTNRQLIGRVSRLGEKYVIVVKVVEGEKGRLLYNETAIVKESDIDSTIEDMADNISDKDAVW